MWSSMKAFLHCQPQGERAEYVFNLWGGDALYEEYLLEPL
jgi:hypothetical protein